MCAETSGFELRKNNDTKCEQHAIYVHFFFFEFGSTGWLNLWYVHKFTTFRGRTGIVEPSSSIGADVEPSGPLVYGSPSNSSDLPPWFSIEYIDFLYLGNFRSTSRVFSRVSVAFKFSHQGIGIRSLIPWSKCQAFHQKTSFSMGHGFHGYV